MSGLGVAAHRGSVCVTPSQPEVPIMPAATAQPIAKTTRLTRRKLMTAGVVGIVGLRTARPVVAGTNDSQFPATVVADFAGKPVRLTLTGTALRTKYWVRVYTVASYAQAGIKIPSPETLARLDVPKLLHLIFERDVDGTTMANAFRESIGKSFPAPHFASELGQLERYFIANPIHQADHIRLSHIPGVGLGVQVNARQTVAIRGVAFAQAAWGTYFGQNHLGVAIKDGLSSRLR